MIEEIELKNVATYDVNGTLLLGLQKINFIYGTNGSGKTTVSNFITNPTDKKYASCQLKWKNEQAINTLVYNKEFKEKNFNATNSIKGVFTLGQATDDEIKIIKKKKEELEVIKNDGMQKKTTLDKLQLDKNSLEESFKEKCWTSMYKHYESDFKDAFKGFMQKNTFKDKLLLEFINNTSALLEFDELKEKSKTIFGELPQLLNTISEISFSNLNTIENESIWDKKIIGKADVDIAKLIQSLNINDWVNQGKNYLQDNNICPFCQQETITDSFRNQLDNYFDQTFIEAIDKINQLKQNYDLQSDNLINQLYQIELEHKNNKNKKLDVDMFSVYSKTLASQFNENKEIINNKIKEPSRSINIVSTKEQLDNIKNLINNANEEIKKHNTIVENYKTEKTQLINSIWKFIANSFKKEIESYQKDIAGRLKGIDKLSSDYKLKGEEWQALNQKIKELDSNVTSVQPTVNEINKILKFYGFLNFEIAPSKTDKNQYQIERENGSLAQETLSEGEITFITFLYYYQLAKGATNKDEVSNDRILVIDDPISSLDSNILFVVSTLIKNIINDIRENKGNIKQLIILTHNVYFHKEVSFINGRDTNGHKDTHFWILKKNNKISTFFPYEMKNPIQTSYQLLWQELIEKEKSSMITIQNTMRRIIENYFKILGNYKDDSLIQKFTTNEEQIICKSLISWINDGSHSITDDLYVEVQDESIDKYLEVFKNVFVFTDHEGHYNMMMGIEREHQDAI
jgi:wobble nucleotide-excising tRNase